MWVDVRVPAPTRPWVSEARRGRESSEGGRVWFVRRVGKIVGWGGWRGGSGFESCSRRGIGLGVGLRCGGANREQGIGLGGNRGIA